MTRTAIFLTSADDRVESDGALFLISGAVLLASSTWFAGTAAAPVLKDAWSLNDVQAAWLTTSVQLGFILGTFLYAALNIADVFKTRNVFFLSALGCALFNSGFALVSASFAPALVFRFLTGISLAGIYPVGMKLVAQRYRRDLGWRLGILVGSLTLGTAIPYALFAAGAHIPWRMLLLVASLLAVAGGILVKIGIGDGPYLQKSPRFDVRAAFRVFRFRKFRLQAFGYFGHMWELYAFWSLAASFAAASFGRHGGKSPISVPLLAFLIIGIGVFGCLLGGWVSRHTGERNVALVFLVASLLFCLLSGFLFAAPPLILIPALLLWGVFVVSDSPQFSALAVRMCTPEYTGTALTIQNGIGFAVSAVSIQCIAWLSQKIGWPGAFFCLAVGPLFGALAMARLGKHPEADDEP
jgi:MFS family permease